MLIEPPILLAIGEPEGIGPDLIPYLTQQTFCRSIVVIGEQRHIPINLPHTSLDDLTSRRALPPFSLLETPGSGNTDASFFYLENALDLLDQHISSVLVTGPIDKKKWLDAGIPYKGHTEFLQSRYHRPAIMFFWSPRLKIALFSVHCPLKSIFDLLTEENIISYLDRLIPCLAPLFSTPCRIAISGLNPHAGEHGIMGDEEVRIIVPAIEKAGKRYPNEIIGPFPPDTVFHTLRKEENVVIVSWYHDQGLIPFKLLHFHEGVNVTLGLPFLRTSPDHGTAIDMKGSTEINPGSMIASVRLAERWLTSPGFHAAVP